MSALSSARVRVSDVTFPSASQYTIERDGVTQGMLADFSTCRQKALFRLNGWSDTRPNSDALYFGSLCHEVLERFYRYKGKKPLLHLRKWIARYVDNNECAEGALLSAKAEALLTVYFEHYAKDKALLTPVRTEEVFRVGHEGVTLRGRKDLVFRFNKSGKCGMMEHKTKSRIDHEYLSMHLSIDIQNCFYDFTETLAHGEKFHTIIYNILQTPQIRPGRRKATKKSPAREESLEDYRERLTTVIRENPKAYFFRYEVTLTKEDRKNFKAGVEAKLRDFSEWLTGNLRHYRNEAACLTPFRCNYLRACSTGYMTGYTQTPIIYPELED